AGAVLVEVFGQNPVICQVFGGRRRLGDVTGRRDVVGGDRVAERGQHARTGDVAERRRLDRKVFEEGGLAHVGAGRIPRKAIAGGNGQSAPAFVTLEYL